MASSIREYHETDLIDVMAAWETGSAQAHHFLSPEFMAKVREDIPKLYIPIAETWVVENDGLVVGFISLLGSEVGALFVDPKHQGKGLGRQLMSKALELRGQLGLEVFSANSIGRMFYRKFGFVQTGEKIHEETGFDMLRLRMTAS